MNGLDLVRKSPRRARRIAIGSDLRACAAARQLSEQKAIQQARIRHAQWLARASSRPPDLWHMEAERQAAEAAAAEAELRAELRRELAEERLHPTVRAPLRPPIREQPEPTVYIPMRAAGAGRAPVGIDTTPHPA
jgi:plasmid stabilization system protein ParE